MKDSPASEPAKSKHDKRFSLKSLLLLVLLFAVLLGGFQFGYQAGFERCEDAGFIIGLKAKFYPVYYRVDDLVDPYQEQQVEALGRRMRQDVYPDSWDHPSAHASIDRRKGCLIVQQSERVHDELAQWIEATRAKKGNNKVTQVGTATKTRPAE